MPNLLRIFKDAKKHHGSTLSQDANGRGPKRQERQETWRLIYDGPVDQITAQQAAGLPIVGVAYNGLVCTRVNPVVSAESPYVWDVTVDYSNDIQQVAGNRTTWNVNIKKASASREETATQDRLGLPLANSFGELLPQLPNVTLYDETFNISFSTSVAPTWDQIEGKTNSDSFTFTICGIVRSFTKSQVKCVGASFTSTKIIDAVTGSETTYKYTYDCELTIQVRRPKWVWYAPNEGWRGYNNQDQIDTYRDPPDDPEGVPRTTPTKLTLEAHALGDGSVPIRLPDGAIGQAVPFGCRVYVDDGAFELEAQAPFSPLFTGLSDQAQAANP